MSVDKLIENFSAKPWSWDELIRLVRERQEEDLERFVALVMDRLPKGGTFLDLAMSAVSEAAFGRLARQALDGARAGEPAEAHETVLTRISLQSPRAVHPYLDELFQLTPQLCPWAWREAGPEVIPFLAAHLDRSQPGDIRRDAWWRLLETRTSEGLSLAIGSAGQVGVDDPQRTYLQEIGYDSPDRPLYFPESFHLIFESGYLRDDRPTWKSRDLHPTWRLPDDSVPYRFGGTGSGTCGRCGEPLSHLLTLPAARVFADRNESGTVSLETCLACFSCFGRPLTYRHDAVGLPHSIDGGEPDQPAFFDLQETSVRLAPTPPRWRWQNWGVANDRENLHRLGGFPCWIQYAAFPDCPDCSSRMHFLMQLDSELPGAGGGIHVWGTGGICYAFRCAPCRTTAYLGQVT